MTTKKYDHAPVWFGYSGTPALVMPPKKCVLVDLDGTLLNNEHRQHFMQGEKKQWASFFYAMQYDTVYPEIKFLIDLIFRNTEHAIVLITGRPSNHHGMTLHNLHDLEINFTSLIMRAQNDNRADREVKLDMLHGIQHLGFEPTLCIDDRPEVVAMWRSQGVPTLQADPKNWDPQEKRAALYDTLALLDENDRLRGRIETLEQELHPQFGR